MALDDYSGLIRSGQAAVPDPTAAAVQQQLASAQVTGANLQNQQAQMQMAMAQRALVRQQQFSQQMQGFVRNPTAQGLASLTGNFPEFSAQAKEAWGPLNEAQRRQEATQMGEIATLAAGGNSDQAAKLFQDRIDADQKAGVERNPQQDQQILGMLKSGDPQQIKAVVAMTAAASGAAVGWDKAGEWLESLGLSKKLSAQPKLEHVETTSPDGSTTSHVFNPYAPESAAFPEAGGQASGAPIAGGGGQASGAGPTAQPPAAGGGMQASIAHAMQNEGRPGNSYNPKDANGSPTNWGINWKANAAILQKMGFTPANFKDMTQEQAAQIYATKYWPQSGAANLPANVQAPYFDVYIRNGNIAKQAWAQSGGDPQKFMQIANAKFQKMASNPNSGTAPYKNAWANRDAGNMALAAGSAPTQGGNQGGVPAAAAPQSNPYQVGGSAGGALNTKGAEPGHAWNATHTAQIPVPGTDADPAAYQGEIEPAAHIWALTGQYPTGGGGMGGGGQLTLGEKNAIAKRGMEILGNAGVSGAQIDALRSKYASDKMAYSNMNGIVSSLTASENALHANAQQVLRTQAPLIQMGIIKDGAPNWMNTAAIESNEHLGSGEQGAKVRAAIKAYRDSVNAFSQEYSKFMTAANGVGGSAAPSDSARAAAGELNDESMGPTTLKRHMTQVLTEAANRRAGFQQQQQTLSQKLDSYLKPPASAGAVHVNNLADYNSLKPGTQYIDPNGVHRVKQ